MLFSKAFLTTLSDGIIILRQTSNKARNRLFAYSEYISILKNGTE